MLVYIYLPTKENSFNHNCLEIIDADEQAQQWV